MNQVITTSSDWLVIGNCRLCGAEVQQGINPLLSTTHTSTQMPFIYLCECRDGEGNRAIRFLSDDHAVTIERLEDQIGDLNKAVADFDSFREEVLKTQGIEEINPEIQPRKRGWLDRLFGRK